MWAQAEHQRAGTLVCGRPDRHYCGVHHHKQLLPTSVSPDRTCLRSLEVVKSSQRFLNCRCVRLNVLQIPYSLLQLSKELGFLQGGSRGGGPGRIDCTSRDLLQCSFTVELLHRHAPPLCGVACQGSRGVPYFISNAFRGPV